MNEQKKWGIDLTGRKMLYEPWPVDEDGNYRIEIPDNDLLETVIIKLMVELKYFCGEVENEEIYETEVEIKHTTFL